MPFVSYAQNLEDVLLWRALGHVGGGRYIDIGAQHPVVDSVSKAFYEQGWRGVHIEPVTQYVELLRQDRPDETVIQAAISDQPGILKFYEIPDTGISTLSEEIAAGHRRNGWQINETLTPALTLDQILDGIDPSPIHWLKIDVEGFEDKVIEGWRASPRRPWVIVVEAIHPITRADTVGQWGKALQAKGYTFVHFDGLNRFYISREHKEIRRRFHLGVCWNDFRLSDTGPLVLNLVTRHDEALGAVRAELTAELSGTLGALDQARAELDEAKGALDRSRAELEEAAGGLATVRNEADQARAGRDLARSEVGRVQGELSQTAAALDRTRSDRDSARDELDQTRAARDRGLDELDRMRTALDRAKEYRDHATAALDDQRDQQQRMRIELDRVAAEMQRRTQEWSHERARLMAELAVARQSLWWRFIGFLRKRNIPSIDLKTEIISPDPDASRQPLPAGASLEELLARHGEIFVRHAHTTLIGREPDPETVRRLLDQLREGAKQPEPAPAEPEITTGAGRDRSASSVEELLALHDEAFVQSAYTSLMGRDPDPAELRRHLARIRNGDSRRAILADLRLSPEGRRRKHGLRGLEREIFRYRAQRLPVLRTLLGLIGPEPEQLAFQRRLQIIETRLDLLVRLTAPSLTGQFDAAPVAARATPNVPAVQTGGAAQEDRPGAMAQPAQPAWSAPSAWQIVGLADGEEPSLTLAETAQALAELGHRVYPPSMPVVGPAVTPLVAAPPRPGEVRHRLPLLVAHEGDESLYPPGWIDGLEDRVCGIACASTFAAKGLIDRGVSVPLAVVGLGVDHWERISASPDYRAPGKDFRFLHVSRCGPGDSLADLVQSFERQFTSDDDVSLIIKSCGAPSPDLVALLDERREANPDFPDVVVIADELTEHELKALYLQCQVFVAPGFTEGFALPTAQALLSGVPAIASAAGGHRDYCDDTNSWLVDFSFERVGTAGSAWPPVSASPKPAALDQALLAAYRADPAERFAKAWAGRKRLLDRFTWKDVALRIAALAERSRVEREQKPGKSRVGWITTWNVKCGIASHAAHLVGQLPADDFVIFAARQEPQIRQDEPYCIRVWEPGKDVNRLAEIERKLQASSVDTLIIQFSFGFFNLFELRHFIEHAVARGVAVLIEMHATTDPLGDVDSWRLSDLLPALAKCHRILVHGPADMERLKKLGLVDNVTLFPLGVVDKSAQSVAHAPGNRPLIASFGFCMPQKGLAQLVEAVSILKRKGRPVRLRMLNAEYPHPDSAAEVQRIRRVIRRFGVEEDVEFYSEFLEEDVLLALLGEADLVVNPYQHTGESASASARYGLTVGRPMAVTPLPFFDDLGDAVFRLPGFTSAEIAGGIADILGHLEQNSETARSVAATARQWLAAHDYSRQGAALMRIANSRAPVKPRRHPTIARGAFINTAEANCSIFESGRMVYNCLKESEFYSLDYYSLDAIDIAQFNAEGSVTRTKGPGGSGLQTCDYDFWVFNWHFNTMAPYVDVETIQRLPGRKFTIVLELEPDDPLKFVPSETFDGYIALDPTTPETDQIVPFPRPLEGDPLDAAPLFHDVPVIGSFGFGTPGKGFELLVEAVNREFDRAVVRFNIPVGTYTTSTNLIHGVDYAQHIETVCRKAAKRGIEIRFTHDFMSPEALLHWCGENDLNCFMYTRRQSGLSATTDQAIMSGRPLLTSTNDTFRHIHQSIPPFPVMSLREAIESTVPAVKRMQQGWSRSAFGKTFERMLDRFEIISLTGTGQRRSFSPTPPPRIVVAHQSRPNPEDIYWYPSRVADCLSRSGQYEVVRIGCADLAELRERAAELQPSTLIVADDIPGATPPAIAASLKAVDGLKIVFADDPAQFADVDRLSILPRQPVIPYFTSAAPMHWPATVWLIGFSDPQSNLEEVVAQFRRELADASLLLEVPRANRRAFVARVGKLRHRLALPASASLSLHSVPAAGGANFVNMAVTNNFSIFYNDPTRTKELENIAALMMATERGVAFTRAAPFPYYRDGATYVEDCNLVDIHHMGMATHIKLYYDFGEWQLYAKLHRLLSRQLAPHSLAAK
jgi:FkbM family methyltransferase